MAIVTVSVHGEILDPDTSLPAVGTVTFKTLIELRDTVDNIVYEPGTWVETLDINGEFTVSLPATDSPDITPTGWLYQVYVSTTHWRETFYISLPVVLAPAVEFADLTPVEPADGSGCTPDGTACAPISLIAEVDALELRMDTAETDIAALEAADVALDARLDILEPQVNALIILTNTHTGQITVLQGDVATLQTQILNIDAAWIVSGILPYQRLGGDIAEADTVVFNRPTLVNPGTAADMWQFRYNGVRVVYQNEFACFRVRGIPDNQVPARLMSNLARDNTALATFQVSLSDATTHWFQVLADGQILGPGALSMLPSTPVAVAFTGNMGNAALINDGNVVNTGAPYAATSTLHAAANRVYLDGNIANNGGVSIPAQTTLFTVTAAHRPTAWAQFTARTSTNLAVRLTIKGATGVVVADQAIAAAATLNLDGFNYRKN